MHALAADFFARHPELSFAALGASGNDAGLELSPVGQRGEYLVAERHEALARQYLTMNQYAFGALGLPRWVLSDLYLLPGAVGLLRCPAQMLPEDLRQRLSLRWDEPALGAAYCAVPSVVPGQFIGVSLLSFLRGVQAGAWVKLLTLRMYRARRMRGVAQWDNPSVRVHTRLGPLRLVGRVPGGHEYAERTFVYETDLADEARVVEAMARRLPLTPTLRIAARDTGALGALLERAEAGEVLHLVPPGLEDGHVLLREGALSPQCAGAPGASESR